MPDAVPQSAPGRTFGERRFEILAAIKRVVESGVYILGPEVQAFEAEFAAYLGIAHVVGVANGTDALTLALRAVGVGSGDAVFTVSHTAVATVAAIEATGATPVFVDVDAETFVIDPGRLRDALSQGAWGRARPRAVVPVHLYGQPADMPAILDIAREAGLLVVEDCAQAHGARLHGRLAGTWGDAAAFSFYPTKNLQAIGDAGAVVTANSEAAAQARQLRQYGWDRSRLSQRPGMNSRLDELQAAVLRTLLPALDAANERRRTIASQYADLRARGLRVPVVASGVDHVYHQYVVRSDRRDAFRVALDADGIGTAIHYPVPVHMQPAYLGRIPLGTDLRVTEELSREIVSLPMFPALRDEEVARVTESASRWAGR